MSRRASYSEGLGYNALGFVVMATLGVAASVVTARIYGAAVLGSYALVVAAANVVMVLSTARERPALVREAASLEARSARLSALFAATLTFSVGLTAVVGAILSVAAYFVLRGPVGHPELFGAVVVAIASYIALDNTIAQVETVFTIFRAGRRLFLVRTVQAVLLAGLTIGLGFAEPTVWSLIAAAIVSSAVTLVWRLVAVLRYIDPRIPRHELRDGFRALPDMIRFGLKIAPGAMADGVSNQAGTWVLGSVSSLAVLGAFNRAWQLARSVLFFNARITEMLFPTLIERDRAGDRAGFDRVLMDTLRYSACGLLILGSVVGGAGAGVMTIFGPGFEQGADALPWLLSVPGLLAIAMVQRHALYVFDRPLQATASAFLRLALTLATLVPLTLWLGIIGPGIALCIGLAGDIAFTTWRVAPHLASPASTLWPVRQRLGLVVAFAAGFLVARAVDSELPGLLGAAGGMIAGGVVYAAALVGVGGIGRGDAQRARRLWTALRSRLVSRVPATADS